MYSEADIKKLVEQVVLQLKDTNSEAVATKAAQAVAAVDDGEIPDITAVDLRTQIFVPEPKDLEALKKMKQSTPARIGVYRAGPRYKTETLLRFRADHAAAMDAVFTDVSDEFLAKSNLPMIQTKCGSKDEYLTRPDLGRQFSDEAKAEIKKLNAKAPQVQIFVTDGLSSTAVEANAGEVLPVIMQSLKNAGISVGTPFFVKYGRVPSMDWVSEVTGAEVTVALVGERPGLVTAESMSVYMAYKATVNMPEARRTVVSNIHRQGTPAVEAGAHVADIIQLMLKNKASGLDLKL